MSQDSIAEHLKGSLLLIFEAYGQRGLEELKWVRQKT